ncbi:phosphotransferase [Streptomyces bathyalis]|uniref:Phosphotransferase n=1 Tax=Streptomyces bathyalis TaxID=2710756 RepID=A0A7T1T4X7_9ACTN|nr:phosphotransferase [Streptomyces bathyalis]QPP06480.1 phosphotransferase [Streptomyces bathyalis]
MSIEPDVLADSGRTAESVEGEPPPAAEGVRLPWGAMPASVRLEIEAVLGGPVEQAVTQPGGFSPGVAARVRLADGRRAFVKAVGHAQNPDSPGMHRAEARIAAALPATVPAPRLLGSFDDGSWVALIYEDVEGRMPAQSWRQDELTRVLGALAELAEAVTPSPVTVPTVAEANADDFQGWRKLVRARDEGEDDLTGLDPWLIEHLDALAAREADWPRAAEGTTLAHSDLRADNVLLTGGGGGALRRLAGGCLAVRWFDLLLMLPSVAMQSGGDPEQIFTAHPVARDADAEAVTTVLAALTGYFVQQSRLPAPPGLPTLRRVQRAHGEVATSWLRCRLQGTAA